VTGPRRMTRDEWFGLACVVLMAITPPLVGWAFGHPQPKHMEAAR